MMRERENKKTGVDQEVARILEQAGEKNIVFVSGNFNIIHPGHLRLLRFAKECGDFLVVGVNGDGMDPGAILPESDRLNGVCANVWVDYAFLLREPAAAVITRLRPATVVKGKEHQNRVNPEQKAVDSYGGNLLFSSGEVAFSSLELLKLDNKAAKNELRSEVREYIRRHRIDLQRLAGLFREAGKYKVAVIGESIIDEYISCEALGLSREEPCMVVSPLNRQRFAGGAAIVAAHIASLGAHVDFVTLAGQDEPADFLRAKLRDYHVTPFCFTDTSRPTIVKQRFRIGNRSLFRVSYLRQHEISTAIQTEILQTLSEVIPGLNLLIFSDFNYGLLTGELIRDITALAAKHHVPILADSQVSSQQGDVSRYSDTLLLTPTEHEARTSLRDNQSGLVVLCEELRRKTNGENVFLKLGAEGMMIHAFDRASGTWETDRLPAVSPAPLDVAGAGDSLLACAALGLIAGGNIWEAALLGTVGAGCQVEHVGNTPLNPVEVAARIKEME